MKEGSSRYSRDQAEFDRAIGFIDAAYALALTLLVTTLVVDDPREAFSSLGALGDAVGGQVLAFAIAFAVIASYWLDHHRLFHWSAWVRRMYFCHMFQHPFRTRGLTLKGTSVLSNPYLS